jgi:hypothetical protein
MWRISKYAFIALAVRNVYNLTNILNVFRKYIFIVPKKEIESWPKEI